MRTDTERLNQFQRAPGNLLVRAWDDGTYAFLARVDHTVPWPESGTEPWQVSLRQALDNPLPPNAEVFR